MKARLEQLGQMNLERTRSSPPAIGQKETAGDVVPAELARASLSYTKARLEQLGQGTLQKSIWFDAEALDLGHDANGVVPAMAGPASTETSLGACLGNSGFYWREEGESDSRLA